MKTKLAALLIIISCIHVYAEPKRIVSVAPSFTETLYALGLGPSIVGTTNFCDYPPEALKTEKIGDILNPNVEKIIRLKPDLVICGAWKWQVPEKLRKAGIQVLELKDAENLEDSMRRILILGQEVGKQKESQNLVDEMQKRINEIRNRSANAKRKKVYIELDAGQWTVGGTSYLTQVAEIVGLQNIFKNRKEPYLMVTMESILVQDPDLILSLNRTKQEYQQLENWMASPCVREGKIIDKNGINWNAITHQSPRMVEGIESLEWRVKELFP
ncbi:MAG TPA: ABC transporter substrate-binding protein [Acidobacteriota bacterium]|nr:ABC transporter substrate-binding protein [Acidobacteriota bacterium]